MSQEHDSKSRIVVQLEEQISTRTNIIVGSNSILFLPFVSLITGTTPLIGYLVWIPVVVGLAAIILNIFWLYSTYKQIILRDKFIERSNIKSYFEIPSLKGEENNKVDNSFYDAFNKAAPMLMIIAWIAILALYILQLQKTNIL